jgi:hypothetical protein
VLIDLDGRQVTASLADALTLVYTLTLVMLDEDTALSLADADTSARRLTTRLENELIRRGLVARNIWEDTPTWPTSDTAP